MFLLFFSSASSVLESPQIPSWPWLGCEASPSTSRRKVPCTTPLPTHDGLVVAVMPPNDGSGVCLALGRNTTTLMGRCGALASQQQPQQVGRALTHHKDKPPDAPALRKRKSLPLTTKSRKRSVNDDLRPTYSRHAKAPRACPSSPTSPGGTVAQSQHNNTNGLRRLSTCEAGLLERLSGLSETTSGDSGRLRCSPRACRLSLPPSPSPSPGCLTHALDSISNTLTHTTTSSNNNNNNTNNKNGLKGFTSLHGHSLPLNNNTKHMVQQEIQSPPQPPATSITPPPEETNNWPLPSDCSPPHTPGDPQISGGEDSLTDATLNHNSRTNSINTIPDTEGAITPPVEETPDLLSVEDQCSGAGQNAKSLLCPPSYHVEDDEDTPHTSICIPPSPPTNSQPTPSPSPSSSSTSSSGIGSSIGGSSAPSSGTSTPTPTPVVRFPAPQKKETADVCRWQGCDLVLDPNTSLLEHIQVSNSVCIAFFIIKNLLKMLEITY